LPRGATVVRPPGWRRVLSFGKGPSMEQLEQAMREIEPSAKDNVTINSNAEEMQEA
jgi:hypothetical protein